MRKFKRNIAAAMIMTMSLSMLPVQFNPTVASAAQTKKVTVKKTEITVNSNKGIKSALKNKTINRIILNAASVKNLNVPKGNYKDKTLVINLSEKSKIHIAKGARFKKIVLVGAVKNASLVIDEAGNKVEIASKTTLSISGKAAYAELTYKTGSEAAKVTSKLELIIKNRTKKTVKAIVAGKKVTVKAGETYSNENLDIKDDETAQGAANIDVNNDSTPQGSAVTDGSSNTTGGNAGGGGFSGGGYSGGESQTNTGGNIGSKTEVTKLVNEKRTKIIDATSFLRYVVVNFENSYTKENTVVYVDGVDITGELTPVDKEGTLVKWEVSSLNPAEVKVVSKADNKISQIVKLNRDTDAGEVVAPVLTKEAKSPKYIIGYGKVAAWDYYLSNYDDEGKLRYKPKLTTFDLNLKATKKLTEKPYYTVPAVEGGDVEVQFNYTDDTDKRWFNEISDTGALQLVQDDENQTTINKELTYRKSFKEHNGKTVAVLTIPTGQINFSNRGYYRVRIKSATSKAVMVRVKVEGRETPEFLLKEPSVKSGKNIHFAVNKVTVGFERPVEKAELVLPTGEVRTLRFISDYYMFNDLFVLYNDVTKGKEEDGTKGVNNTLYNGNYILRVYFHSYRTVEKEFRITDGKDVEKKEEKKTAVNKVMTMGNRGGLLSVDGMRFDAIAGASKVSTTPGSSSGGGGRAISANIIFNTDLVGNAEIFDKLGIDNAYAKGIVDRFEKDMTNYTAVYDEEGKVFYDWNYYNDAVNTARTKNKYLTFSEYVKTPGVRTTNRLTRVKEVLEDNLLGELVMDGSYLGKTMEGFTYPNGNEIKENEELVVYADKTYLSKIKVLHNQYYTTHYDGTQNSYSVKTSDYRVEGDKLIIKGSAFFRDQFLKEYKQKLTITVYADGYQPYKVEAVVLAADKNTEEPNNPENPKNPDNGNTTTPGKDTGKTEDTSKNAEPAFTELKYNSGYGVHELYINPKREDLINATGVKMYVKGNDGSYKEIERSSLKKDGKIIKISDLNWKSYPTTISEMLVEGDNTVRVEFVGVAETVDMIVTRTGKYYSTRFTLKSIIPKQDTGNNTTPDKEEKKNEPAFTELKYNSGYGVHELYINPKREDLINATGVKMYVKGNDGSYKEIERSSLKKDGKIIKISDLNWKSYPTTISEMLTIGDNDMRIKFDGVEENIDIVINRDKKYGFRLSLKK